MDEPESTENVRQFYVCYACGSRSMPVRCHYGWGRVAFSARSAASCASRVS